MTDIPRLQQLIAAVQSAATDKARRSTEPTQTQAKHARSLEQRLAADVAALDVSSEEGRRMARRRFVQSVLIDQLGDRFANSPVFAAVSQEVEATFSENPALREDLDSLLIRWSHAR